MSLKWELKMGHLTYLVQATGLSQVDRAFVNWPYLNYDLL